MFCQLNQNATIDIYSFVQNTNKRSTNYKNQSHSQSLHFGLLDKIKYASVPLKIIICPSE